MMLRAVVLALLIGSAATAAEEVYRIRIENVSSGLVQVSLDRGRTYWTVGQVIHPANARIIGFAAASYTPAGTIAAIATHGIRIKTGQLTRTSGKSQMPLIFSVVPHQFAKLPHMYGGHIPRSSGILTNIDAGHSIFRNQSPYVGNPVFIERGGNLEPLPEDYLPAVGDVFVINVEKPDGAPHWIEFENKTNGKVTAHFDDGRAFEIAKVVRPVRGIGRYDGTTYTGTGAINTNHGGVITIATAPGMPSATKEGGAKETRGGFMIQPIRHATEQHEFSPQVMVIAPPDNSDKRLEGVAPLFRNCINLAFYPENPECSYRVQIKIDEGEWENMPAMTGKLYNAFEAPVLRNYFANTGHPRSIRKGVTGIRILFPRCDSDILRRDLVSETSAYTSRTASKATNILRGTAIIRPITLERGRGMVNIYLDGCLVSTVNEWPYQFEWDTTSAPNGWHSVRFEQHIGPDKIKTERKVVLVAN